MKGKGEVDNDVLNEALLIEDDSRIYNSINSPKLKAPIGLFKHNFGTKNELSSQLISQEVVDLDDNEELNENRDAISANWMNPYLAI